MPLSLTILFCIVIGCIGSEYIQSLLPVSVRKPNDEYKMFQFGDVIANLLGGSIGLYISYKLEQKYRRSDANGLHESPDLENPGESDNQLLYEFRSDL